MSRSEFQRQRQRERTASDSIRPRELKRLEILLRHATAGAWAIALYNTAAVRDRVMDTLRDRLDPLPVYDFTFTEARTNPVAYLENLPADVQHDRAIVFLYDLTRGGARVWGYLEMQLNLARQRGDRSDVAKGLNNLGLILLAQGDLSKAQTAFERALRVFEQFLPPNHPHIATVRENLARLEDEAQ